MAVSWSLDANELTKDRRFDPEFFDPRVVSVESAIAGSDSKPLRKWVKSASRGTSPTYDPNGNARVIKTAHVQRFELLPTPAEFVLLDADADLERAVIAPNSLLITSTGVGSLGRTFFYSGSESLVADGHVTVLPVIGTPEDGAFVCAYLQSPAGRQQIIRQHRGSSRQIEVYPADLLRLSIPDLPDSERRKIGEMWIAAARGLEDARAAVGEAESIVAQRIGLDGPEAPSLAAVTWEAPFKTLLKAKRLDADHALPEVERLRNRIIASGARSLQALSLNVSRGVQPASYNEDGDIRVIKSKDVFYPEFDLARCERATNEGWNALLEAGNLLLNTTGEGTLGRAGVVPVEGLADLPTVAAVDISIIDIDSTQALPEYVALFLNSWMGRRQTTALQTGSSGQQHIYPAHFARIYVPIPLSTDGKSVDLDWQREVVSVAERRSAAVSASLRVGADLDAVFASLVGVSVDLSTVPI